MRLLLFFVRLSVLLVLITVNAFVARIAPSLLVTTVTPASYPISVDVDDDGTVLVASCNMCTISRMPRGGTFLSVIAGITGICGYTDDVGTSARLSYPLGMSRVNTTLYFADELYHCIRVLDLISLKVSTVTGSSQGFLDNPFASALFYWPNDVRHYSTAFVRVLYILDYENSAIRKADFNSGLVSTIAFVAYPIFSSLNKNGTLLFVASSVQTIVRVDVSTGTAVIIAGSAGAAGYIDEIGVAARFSDPRGVAWNDDETALYVGDRGNLRLRRIELSNMNVTTVAGTGASSSINGPPLASTFQIFGHIQWYCDRLTTMCGVMVSQCVAEGSIRWIPFTQGTMTSSTSLATAATSKSVTPSPSLTDSSSMLTVKKSRSVPTSASQSISSSPSKSRSVSRQPSGTLTHSSILSRSSTKCNTLSFNTSANTWSEMLSLLQGERFCVSSNDLSC
ncbi:membrane-associated protein, putative [Bodo saltans]|uniref:Membrane-associated protein, putative n=1 Tax=Bodo saltans TaxID=75058 RepID=A0A0S4IUK1_BODSA|nr:membrane-associated protein, putative [Bodo saltans]|eukprot:CUF98610.1 membrane-associated protein, putative [Bodo saltans]